MKYHPRLWNLFRREQGWIPHHHQSSQMQLRKTNQKEELMEIKNTAFFAGF